MGRRLSRVGALWLLTAALASGCSDNAIQNPDISTPHSSENLASGQTTDWSVIDAYRPAGAALDESELDRRKQQFLSTFMVDALEDTQDARDLILQIDALAPLADPDAVLLEADVLSDRVEQTFRSGAPLSVVLLTQRVWALVTLNRLDEAESTLARARSVAERVDGPAKRLVQAQVMSAQAYLYQGLGRMSDAADMMRAAHNQLSNPEAFELYDHANMLRGAATLEYMAGRQTDSVRTGQEAVALLDLSVDPRRANQIDRYVGGVGTLAALQGISDQADAAFANQEKAARLAAAYLPEDSRTVATLLHNYAHGLTRRGRYREAEGVYRAALKSTAKAHGSDHYEFGLTLGKLGEAQIRQGQYDRAEATLGRALEIVRSGAAPLDVSYIASDAAEAAAMAGRLDRADTYFREAVDLIEAGDAEGADPHPPISGVTHLYYSDLLMTLGRYEEALAQAKDGMARILPALDGSAEGRLARAQLVFALSQSAPEVALSDAKGLADEIERELGQSRYAEQGWSKSAMVMRRPLALLAQVAIQAQDKDEALRILQLATLTDVAEWEQSRRLSDSEASPEQGQHLENTRRVREAIKRTENRLSQAVAAADGEAADAARVTLSGLKDELSAFLDTPISSSAAIQIRSLQEVQQNLRSDEAVLVVITNPRPSAVLIRKDGAHARKSDVLHPDLQRAAALLRQSVLEGNAQPGTVGMELGWMLEAGDLEGVEQLHVLGTDVYGQIPLHLLTDPDDASRWLGEQVAVRHLTSLGSLSEEPAEKLQDRPAIPRLVALGDSIFSETDSGGSGTKTRTDAFGETDLKSRLAALPRLPATRDEVMEIARAFDGETSVLLGQDATEAGFRAARPETADLIVLATHGLMEGELLGLPEPSLVFSSPDTSGGGTESGVGTENDGLLTASESADLVLAADLVVLSACNTAASDGDSQPLSGLPRAFLSAGAKSVMVSHWSVRDDAAAFLSKTTYENQTKGLSPALALRDAMAQFRTSGIEGADDPSVWAPFVIVGG